MLSQRRRPMHPENALRLTRPDRAVTGDHPVILARPAHLPDAAPFGPPAEIILPVILVGVAPMRACPAPHGNAVKEPPVIEPHCQVVAPQVASSRLQRRLAFDTKPPRLLAQQPLIDAPPDRLARQL